MKRSYRIAVRLLSDSPQASYCATTHYVIRDDKDLDNMLNMLRVMLTERNDVDSIKWVPIPDLEEVHHAE